MVWLRTALVVLSDDDVDGIVVGVVGFGVLVAGVVSWSTVEFVEAPNSSSVDINGKGTNHGSHR